MSVFELGTTYGKYRILRQLGRGGIGVVYLAEDGSLGRLVALKVIDPALSLPEEFEVRFRKEARTVAALTHPNIVQIHALEKIDNRLVVEMAYVEGGSLLDAEAAGPLSPVRATAYMRDVLLALAS